MKWLFCLAAGASSALIWLYKCIIVFSHIPRVRDYGRPNFVIRIRLHITAKKLVDVIYQLPDF